MGSTDVIDLPHTSCGLLRVVYAHVELSGCARDARQQTSTIVETDRGVVRCAVYRRISRVSRDPNSQKRQAQADLNCQRAYDGPRTNRRSRTGGGGENGAAKELSQPTPAVYDARAACHDMGNPVGF